MADLRYNLVGVSCPDFETSLNCSTMRLPVEVQRACCGSYDATEQPPRRFIAHHFGSLYKCCEALEGHGYAPPKHPEWENSSYQAYVMGIAVFAILICLFVSGARSVRRRRMLLRAQMRQQRNPEGLPTARPPEFNTQISLGPPTYGELEARGLTKDYKTGAFDPPPYPGIAEDQGECIQCVAPPIEAEENRSTGENSEKAAENDLPPNNGYPGPPPIEDATSSAQ